MDLELRYHSLEWLLEEYENLVQSIYVTMKEDSFPGREVWDGKAHKRVDL